MNWFSPDWFRRSGAVSTAEKKAMARDHECARKRRTDIAAGYQRRADRMATELSELTDAEVTNLTGLYAESGGEAGSFGFVDPFANCWAGAKIFRNRTGKR